MDQINRLREHYKSNPPRLSYGGSEGEGWKGLAFVSYPQEEAGKSLGLGTVIVWRGKFPSTNEELPVERHCVVTVCLDSWGNSNPEAIPLHPEMEGHAVDALIYVDMMGNIHAKAIGGATTHATRNALLERKMLNGES